MFICLVALPGGAHGETITINNKAILTDQIENASDDFTLILEPDSSLAVSDQDSSVKCIGKKAGILLKKGASIANLGDEPGNNGIIFAAAPDAEGSAVYSLTLEDKGVVSAVFEDADATSRNSVMGVSFKKAVLGNVFLDNGSSLTAHGIQAGSISSHEKHRNLP